MSFKKYVLYILATVAFSSLVLFLIVYFAGRSSLAGPKRHTGEPGKNLNRQEFEAVDSTKSFSVVILPDTQVYSKFFPETTCGQANWVLENKEKLNIVFVNQLGDLVEDGGKDLKQWGNVSNCLSLLDDKVPYEVLPGNHDMEEDSNLETRYKTYQKYFGEKKFKGFSSFGGSFRDNRNNYSLVEANGVKLLFLNLEVEADNEVIAWASKIISQNKDSMVILSTHLYLSDDDSGRSTELDYTKGGNTGENLFKKLVYPHCNVDFVLNGHFHTVDGEARQVSKNSCGEDVFEIAQNYQGRTRGGEGKLRVYTFTPSTKTVSVKTYATETGLFEKDKDSEFTLTLN